MSMKKWIAGTLSMLAIGGTIAVSEPTITYATENAPAVQEFQRGAGAAIGRVQGSMNEVISNLLGMDRTEIIKERQSGKSMVDIAQTKGVDENKLVDTIMENRKDVIDQRLKEGAITQEQAQYCEDNMEQRIKANLNRTTTGPANGQGRKGAMRGGMKGGRFGGMWQQQ